MVTAIDFLDRYAAMWAWRRYLLDFSQRFLVLAVQSFASSLEFFTSLVLVPIGLAGNAVLVTAFVTAEDGLIRTAWVNLTRFTGRGETVSEVWVCCKSCSDTCLLIPRSTLVSHVSKMIEVYIAHLAKVSVLVMSLTSL